MISTPQDPNTAEHLLALYLSFDQALLAAESVTVADTAQAVTRLTSCAIPGVEQASITEGRSGRFRTVASTGQMATCGDLIQYELGNGPCVGVLADGGMICTGNVAADPRWPEFGPRVNAETGAVSMLSYWLYREDDLDRVTGLNLYSTQLDAFDDLARTVGTVLAGHSARAMITATARDKAAHMHQALDSNREIGTAMGIVMAAHKVTRAGAFDLLRTVSQNNNRKLIEVATEVVDTGTLRQSVPG